MKKSQKRGYISEKRQARKRGGRHVGGPGKEDYRRGRTKGEVKNWSNPVHSGVIKNAAKKGIKEIVSPKSGFTEPAKKEAKKRGIKLVSKGKSVKK